MANRTVTLWASAGPVLCQVQISATAAAVLRDRIMAATPSQPDWYVAPPVVSGGYTQERFVNLADVGTFLIQ